MNCRRTAAADSDLINVYVEGVTQFGVAQAENYFDRLETTFQTIADNPKIARERTEIKPPVRAHPCGSHIIIYEIDGLGVLILRVRHHSEDWVNNPI